MKRKSAPKRSRTRRTTSRGKSLFSSQRTLIITFALLVVVFGLSYRDTNARAVLGASIFRPLFAESTITWQPVDGASGYDIYYKQNNEDTFSYSVMNLPPTATSYTVKNLKKGVTYLYQVSAIVDGADVPTAGLQTMTVSPM